MPRSNWKGVISFGLVTIPIVLYNSENQSEKISFHQIDKRDNARIKYSRVNAETGEEVSWDNIIKAFQYDKDTILPVEEDELKYVAGEQARTIEIENFIEKANIDFINVEKTYYLVPDKNGQKGYVILREALRGTNKVGIARVIISTKEYLASIACYQNALVLYLMRYQEEIKPLSDFDIPSDDLKAVKATSKEVDIAKQVIKSMSTKWKPEKFRDEYARIVHEWAEQKIKHKTIPKSRHSRTVDRKDNVIDFVGLLKESLKKTKTSSSKKAKASTTKVKKGKGQKAS